MKDFEKEIRKLERQMNELGEKMNKRYAQKYGKEFGEKFSRVWNFDGGDNENKDGEKGVLNNIQKILPYLDEDSLHELTVGFIDGDSQVDMKKVLPYLESDDISLLIKKLAENDAEEFNGLTVDDILPYAEDEDVDVLFMKGVREGKIDRRLMSYVSDDCRHELVKEYCSNENSALNIDEVFPYLDEDDIRLIFKTYLKRQKKNI